jgi:hypothetical protein
MNQAEAQKTFIISFGSEVQWPGTFINMEFEDGIIISKECCVICADFASDEYVLLPVGTAG